MSESRVKVVRRKSGFCLPLRADDVPCSVRSRPGVSEVGRVKIQGRG